MDKKKIHLIRHAKSSWEDDSLDDIARPLNERGTRTCNFMAGHIWKAGCCFDHVFCSPAVRARSTIELIARSLPEVHVQWKIAPELYPCEGEFLLNWFGSLDEPISEVLIIGHNPGLTDVCNRLSRGNVKNIPTCGYVQLAARKECRWKEISKSSFQLELFLWPKKLRN